MRFLPLRLTWLWLVIAGALVTGCGGTRGGSIPYATETLQMPDAVTAPVSTATTRLTTGDVVLITVFQAEKLSTEYKVDDSGAIRMPLIGAVPAAGRPLVDVQQEIAQRLGAKYLNNPDVTVVVKESSNRLLTVDGSVRQPGMFPVQGELTLIQAVALARGTDDNANPRRVGIFRTIGGKRMAAAFDLTSIRRGEEPDPQVYAGDIIVVDGSSTRSTFTTILTTLPILALFRPY